MPNTKIHTNLLEQLSLPTAQHLTKSSNILKADLKNTTWTKMATAASQLNYRLVTLFAQEHKDNFIINVILELHGSYLWLRTITPKYAPNIDSIAQFFPAANRLERHTTDMFGINFNFSHDNRRWTRHQAWREDQFPLRKNFDIKQIPTTITPPDFNYTFLSDSGSGICEIPVGPVHAGIIEPGHFRFHVAGEDIINLEEHLGYTHKGIEKIAEGKTPAALVKLAGRISGDSTVSHAWAASAALENACGINAPERSLYIRAIICERERIINHLGDFAAICNDVAYTFPYYQLTRLKEFWLQLNAQIFKHRFMMDCIIPGGVAIDIDQNHCQLLLQQNTDLKKELEGLLNIFEAHSGLHDRAKTTGILSHEQAKLLGVLGYAGRASGLKFDLRHDRPYPPYDRLNIKVPVFYSGDVLARLRIRFQEILIAIELIDELIKYLPSGAINTNWTNHKNEEEGIGIIEGWRGEIVTFVAINSNGLIERFFPRDPSWFSWLALEKLIHGNIVPDFPVCNKSINGSYSGVDL